LALFRQGKMQAEIGDIPGPNASMDEAKELYAKVVKGHEGGDSDITVEQVEAAVPLSSR